MATISNGESGSSVRTKLNDIINKVEGVTSINNDITFSTGATLRLNTSDGSDNGVLAVSGGGANSDARGARVRLYGNEHASLGGVLDIGAGNVSGGHIYNYTNAKLRQKIDYNGNISFYEDTGITPKFFWDAGAENLNIGTTTGAESLSIKDNAGFQISFGNTSASSIGAIGYDNNDKLNIYGNGTTRMTIDSSGNVNLTGLSNGRLNFAGGNTSGGSKIQAWNDAGNANGYLAIEGYSIEYMRIDSSGNVGIGVVPSAWRSTTDAIQFGQSASISSNNNANAVSFTSNAYINSSNDSVRISTGKVTNYYQFDGAHVWDYAGSDAAGTTVTYSEAMRIDGSGNLQVGTTQTFPAFNNVVGCEVGGFGQISASRDGAEAMQLNRKTSDGDIALFKKDGATVGSIGAFSGQPYFAGTETGIKPYSTGIVPTTQDGTSSDGAKSLGAASARFKDLYLSGGVVFGDAGGSGTSTSNTLDSYEEGNWTPTVSTGSLSVTGTYVKVGKLVSVFLNGQVTTGGATQISGLPFTTAGNYGFSPYVSTQDISTGQNSITFVTNGSDLLIRSIGDNTTFSTTALTTGAYIHASFVYQTT